MNTSQELHPVDLYLAFGSNMGDRVQNIHSGITLLSGVAELVTLSPLYETEPVGYDDQDWFVNCVGHFWTVASPQVILKEALRIEKELKRVRRMKNGPRTIDIDLLLYGDVVLKEDGLRIPHPRMHERRFVLAPMCDIAPDLMHPTLHQSMRQLLAVLPEDKAIKKIV